MYSIVATQPGDISVLQKKEFEISEILPNQVLIKNHSIGVNFIDIYFRKGLYPWPQENNLVLGSEGAGIIEAVGSDVVNLRVGDRVAYAQANNAYATHRILDANLVVRVPDAISFDQAAAAMLKELTHDAGCFSLVDCLPRLNWKVVKYGTSCNALQPFNTNIFHFESGSLNRQSNY